MKKSITLQEAYDLIAQSEAIIIDREAVVFPSLWEITNEPENEWLYCSWEDSDYHEFSVTFIEEKQDILFDGTTIYMKDSEDEDTEITLLVKMGSS